MCAKIKYKIKWLIEVVDLEYDALLETNLLIIYDTPFMGLIVNLILKLYLQNDNRKLNHF